MPLGFAGCDPGQVPADAVLCETVVFELPMGGGAERLRERLRPRWSTQVFEHEDGALVAVDLRSAEGDLATLLRTIQFWAHGTGRHLLRFHLDGRAYVLEARAAIWPAAVA
jgi:hypothetical protein